LAPTPTSPLSLHDALPISALRSLRHRYPREPLVLAAQPRIGGLLAALGVVDRALPFDALDLDGLFGSEPRDPAPLIREATRVVRSEEHTSELQSLAYLVCR